MKGKPWLFENKVRPLVVMLCLLVLIIIPLLVDSRVSARDSYYNELVRVHECVTEICVADFDADGTLGRLFIDRSSSVAPHEYWLVAKENGKELIRLPYWELDNTARTHVATSIEYSSGKTHLLVYESKGREAPVINAVYAWNGNEMRQVPPSEWEKELFKALATRDQNGTLSNWVLYRMVRMPIILAYYIGLILVSGMLAVQAYRSALSSLGPSTREVV